MSLAVVVTVLYAVSRGVIDLAPYLSVDSAPRGMVICGDRSRQVELLSSSCSHRYEELSSADRGAMVKSQGLSD